MFEYSRVSSLPTCWSLSVRTNDVYVRVGSGGSIVLVSEVEGSRVTASELGLGADTPETPRSVGSTERQE